MLIFQQLGQLVRWSWGYHVLLAPADKYIELPQEENALLEGRLYRDDPDLQEALIPGLDGHINDDDLSGSEDTFESGGRTPVNARYIASDDEERADPTKAPGLLPTPTNGNLLPTVHSHDNITSFPRIRSPTPRDERNIPAGIRGLFPYLRVKSRRGVHFVTSHISHLIQKAFNALPQPMRQFLAAIYSGLSRFLAGLWEFMNPPLWAMLIAVIVASIPKLQHLFFAEGSFIANSVTRAIGQSGGVAVPLILVVLGANLARNTLPQEVKDADSEENKIETKLLVASLISRMLLPTMVMAPLLALAAKYVPVSILDDPIFVIVCFLLTGAPSALQLAQICQINDVYQGVMSKLLFQSYVIW